MSDKRRQYALKQKLHWLRLLLLFQIFPNISRSKDNQTMKFGQLIEDNMRKFFLEKRYLNCRGENCFKSVPEKSKLCMSLELHSEILYRLLLLYVRMEDYQVVLKLGS